MCRTKAIHTSVDETMRDMQQRMPRSGMECVKAYAILLRPDGSRCEGSLENGAVKPRMIGIVGTKQDLEIAYKLHPDFWEKGYMSEALSLFLQMFWSLEGRLVP